MFISNFCKGFPSLCYCMHVYVGMCICMYDVWSAQGRRQQPFADDRVSPQTDGSLCGLWHWEVVWQFLWLLFNTTQIGYLKTYRSRHLGRGTVFLIFSKINKPNKRHMSVPNPQWPGSFPLEGWCHFTASPFPDQGARNKAVKEGILPGPPEGKTAGLQAWAVLLTPLSFLPSEASEIALPPGSGVTVLIRPRTPALPGKPCYIIFSKKHMIMLSIKSGERKAFSFNCQNPEHHFVVEIQKNIGKCALLDWPPCLPFSCWASLCHWGDKICFETLTLFSFYLAGHGSKCFIWVKLFNLQFSPTEVHRDSNLPEVTPGLSGSKTRTQVLWLQSLGLEPLSHTVSEQSSWTSGLRWAKDICQGSWRTKEIEGWREKSEEMSPRSTNGENSSFGGWGSWVWLQAPRRHTDHVTWSCDILWVT